MTAFNLCFRFQLAPLQHGQQRRCGAAAAPHGRQAGGADHVQGELLRGVGSPAHAPRGARRHHGRAVQVDPMNPKLKPPRTKRLKVKYDKSLFNFASNLLSNSTCAATPCACRAPRPWRASPSMTSASACESPPACRVRPASLVTPHSHA
jgi:hypothetical protein